MLKIHTFPNGGNDGARREILGQSSKERLGGEIRVMGLSLSEGGLDQLQADELVAAGLEALDDFTDEVALHSVRLDSDEGALEFGARLSSVRSRCHIILFRFLLKKKKKKKKK